MKFQTAFAFLALAPVAAFTGLSAANTRTSSTKLYDGMAAYDAQMRAMTAAANNPPPVQQQQQQQQAYGGVAAPVPNNIQSYDPAANMVFTPAGGLKQGQRFRKKTKQLATLGPASSTFEMIEKLFLAGADVFRLNFSHGEHAQKKELLDIIRAVEAKYEHPIAVLGDLQGPKLRVGTFANPEGETLQAGQAFRFDLDPTPGNYQRVMLPHPEIIEASQVGHALLIDDGKVKVRVAATGPGYLDCVVEVPGKIKDKKVIGCESFANLSALAVTIFHLLIFSLFFLQMYRESTPPIRYWKSVA